MEKKPTYEDLEQRIRILEKGQEVSEEIDSTHKNPEAVYRIMLESISDTVIVTDDQGNMLYVCPNSAIIFGLSQDEILRLNTIQKLMNGSFCDTSDLKEQGEIQNIEWKIKDANRQTRFLLINVKSVNINGGSVLYVMRDITDRKQDEEDLKKYRNIVSSTPDGISLLDKNYRYIIVNDAYEKFSGGDRENIVGLMISEYLGKEAFEKYIQPNFDKCLKGETINYQEWFEYPTLGKRFVDITYYPYRDSDDNITGVVANTRDITSQRLIEEDLSEIEGKFRSVMEAMVNPVYICSSDFKIEYMNPAMIIMAGHDGTGEICYKLIHDLNEQCPWCVHDKIQQGKHIDIEIVSPKKNRNYHISNVPIIHKDGSFSKMAIYRDITERKQEEEALKISRENLLEESNQRKILSKKLIELLEKDRHYIAMELHDNIGQILTSLKINLEILDDKLKPTDTELGSLIKTAIRRAQQAIEDLNIIAQGLMPGILDALGLVSSLRTLLNEVKEHTDIKIKFFNRNVPKRFDQEKELAIYRIVQEALNNIIKHAEAKNVHVSLLNKGNVLFLSVEDDGVGFDQDKAMKISKGKGPLGLIIMQERAMQLDGELTIESKMGKGTHLLTEIPI